MTAQTHEDAQDGLNAVGTGMDTTAPPLGSRSRLDAIARTAWPECQSALSHESWHLPLVRRVLTATLNAAEASPELPTEYVMRACLQARTENTP